MTLVFGWWDWDAEAPGMVNRVTGERVVYRGRALDEEVLLPDRQTWLRFDYLHSELTFPLLVQEVPGRVWNDGDKKTWQLDYRRSAALWRRETGASEPNPSYGVWRRVDDCVSDALACWPESEIALRPLAEYVHLDGGWLNGTWREEVRRSERRVVIHERLRPDDSDYTSWLIPLDTQAPSPFLFHDYQPEQHGEEKLIPDNPVFLKGLQFRDPELRFNPKLPPDEPLTQLEGRTAYLLSQDRSRLLYPYFGDTERQKERGHWTPRFKLLYVDEYVVMSVIGAPWTRSETGAMWSSSPVSFSLGWRREVPDTAFFLRPYTNQNPRPSRALLLHLRWGLAEGWNAWDGSEARHKDWLEPLVLMRVDGTWMFDGYHGGRWGAGASFIVQR